MVKAIISLSGGMDSATVLACALENKREVFAISFSYGSKHQAYENSASIQIARHYGVQHRFIDLCTVMTGFKSNLLKTGGNIPEGHYEADNMKLTIVPARNIIFASILAGIAVSEGAEEIWLGVHTGDHAIYPDCRPDFVRTMEEAIQIGTDSHIKLVTPFLYDNKKIILRYGMINKVPYHLTRTCYKAQPTACGKCGSCQERLAAFEQLGVEDPIDYESREVLPR
jgi:7-cyano-7-deazaguanine synthase